MRGSLLAVLVLLAGCAPAFRPLRPLYPDLGRQAGIHGAVEFRIAIDSRGRPDTSTFQVLRSVNPVFTAAVRSAVLRWRPVGVRSQVIRHEVWFVLLTPPDSTHRCDSTPVRSVVCVRPAVHTHVITVY